jgi:hypothetical protein
MTSAASGVDAVRVALVDSLILVSSVDGGCGLSTLQPLTLVFPGFFQAPPVDSPDAVKFTAPVPFS